MTTMACGRARTILRVLWVADDAAMDDLNMDERPPTRSPDVALQRVGQEAILHDRRNGRAHVINESAARIWDLCDGQASLDEIAVALAASYNIEASVVQGDVAQIVAKFRELRVLEA
jgi:PqqD family protein of HPr-rel-A system